MSYLASTEQTNRQKDRNTVLKATSVVIIILDNDCKDSKGIN